MEVPALAKYLQLRLSPDQLLLKAGQLLKQRRRSTLSDSVNEVLDLIAEGVYSLFRMEDFVFMPLDGIEALAVSKEVRQNTDEPPFDRLVPHRLVLTARTLFGVSADEGRV
ncbi:hypothetical protein SPHINGO8AM_80260 [Sphingomonas sp. 8AM]|nr:hypothetical protein SPHINGO8AM_80260 [Sphingomonas sp. 8AM]